ncbi:MAG: hypothetical protein AAF558_13085 [Verrucomicrobiota bacterium]
MPDSNDEPFPWFECLAFLPIAGGCLIALYNWWCGASFWEQACYCLVIFFGGGLFLLIKEGYQTGKLPMRGGHLERAKHPWTFFGFICFYAIAGIGLLFTGFAMLLLGGVET